jgi:uncharacterized protein
MDKRAIRIFFTIFFTIYGAVNYYIFIRGFQGLELASELRTGYTILFIFIATSYFICRIIERKAVNALSVALFWIGSFWFGFILYFLLSIVILDLLRLINNVADVVTFDPETYPAIKLWITLGLITIVMLTLFLGYLNAKRLKIKTLHLTIDKYNPEVQELNIVMASDIHLGSIVGKKRALKIVKTINSLKPDIILLPGDILDSEIAPVVWLDLGAVLRELSARYGIFAVTGNHEYIGGIKEAVAYIREHRIDLLRDEVREIAGVTIVGREDYTIKNNRKPLPDLMEDVDRNKAVILMDHQPFHLEEAEKAGVDLQVSGHTHRGQLWPLSYITNMVYEIDWGYLKKGDTHIYVSSGVGTWGPPVKIGNDAEIMQFVLHFKEKPANQDEAFAG